MTADQLSLDIPDPGYAWISDCERYRYLLGWAPDRQQPALGWLLLNPSTATAETVDNTVRRVKAFTARWNYAGYEIANPFAWRATDPRELRDAQDPVGPRNDEVLRGFGRHPVTVLGWGKPGSRYPEQIAHTMGMLVSSCLNHGTKLAVLGWTKCCQPKHPLYLPAATPLDVVDVRLAVAGAAAIDGRFRALIELGLQRAETRRRPPGDLL